VDKTQILSPEALQAAQGRDNAPGQATVAIPAGLPMLTPLPPLGEEPTQPIRLDRSLEDAEAEALAIVRGPDATVRLPVGAPLPPADSNATVALPVGNPVDPGATQALVAGSPQAPAAAATQVMQPEVRTVEIPPDQLPASRKRRLPLWAWGALAVLVLGLGFGGVYALQPQWLGIRPQESEPATEPPPTTGAKTEEAPAPEIPQALRHYFDEAEKGDAAAMRMLGVMYYNGLNVPRNEAEGLKWYRKAADHGSKAAQKELKLLEGKAASK
jgi:hypothetical protein